jgi:hypothetical protein
MNYLEHHGILGQKWGIRRYQNPDGSLTNAGKKRYSDEYKELAIKAQKQQYANNERIKLQAWNETAEEYNNYKLKSFDKNDPDYNEKVQAAFSEDFNRNYKKSMLEFTKNNKYYKQAAALAKKYDLYSYDELAKDNKEFIESMEKTIYGK